MKVNIFYTVHSRNRTNHTFLRKLFFKDTNLR